MAPGARKQLMYSAWAEFITFSQHTVAARGKGSSKNKCPSIPWDSQFTSAWNPYLAGHEEVSLYLTLHKQQLKTEGHDLDMRTEALCKYLPHVEANEVGTDGLADQSFPYPLVVMMGKGSLKHKVEWNDFVQYCVKNAKVDPFLAEPQHVRDFILRLFFNWKATDSILKPFPNFYQDNITHLIEVLEFYLKSSYDKNPMEASVEMKDILAIAECLDEHLDESVEGSQELLERLTPPHWYWYFKKRNPKKDFWQHRLVKKILEDVRNKILTENDAAWQLGVTPDMVACAMQREKPQDDEDTTVTMKQYLKMKMGKEEDFWKEESTQKLMEDVRNRLVTVDNAAFQLGVTSTKVIENAGEIKTDAEAEVTKRLHKKCSISSPRAASSPRSPRLKMIADRKEMERGTGGLQNSGKIERQSPGWVGKLTPEAKSRDSKQRRKLSEDEMRPILHVPKMTVPTNELIANNLDYRKGVRFMERLYAEVEVSTEEESLKDNGMWKGMKPVGERNVSAQELMSLDVRGDIVAFGDRAGGVGFWLGERSLVYRPHNLPVCRTMFTGSGADTKLVSASHDGTVRVLDFEKQEFQVLYSWHKHSSTKEGVVWIEPVDENNWLVNCEEGNVLQVDRRDQSIKTLLQLKEARRSTFMEYDFATGRKSVTPALAGSSISVHPVNRNIFSISNEETVDIYDIRNSKTCMSSIDHPSPPSSRMHASTQFDILNYHAGSGWNNSGALFMTCPRTKALQGTINVRPASDLAGGVVTEWPGDKHQTVTSANLLMCQGAIWCPWQENVLFASVNKKSGAKSSAVTGSKWGLMAVDMDSGETMMDLNLSSPVNLMGVHPSRPQIVVGNSSGPGIIQIFNSTVSTSQVFVEINSGKSQETAIEDTLAALDINETANKDASPEDIEETVNKKNETKTKLVSLNEVIELEKRKQEETKKKEEARRKEEERKKEEARKNKESERIEREKVELEKIRAREVEKEKIRILDIEKEKRKIIVPSSPKTPIHKTKETGPTSYEMTPSHHELPPQRLEDANNYNIDEICSEDSTDDEEAPRKEVAKWAEGIFLRTALLKQSYVPPDLDELFQPIDQIELSEIFDQPRDRFVKRTSSGDWDTPPRSYKHKEQRVGGHFERMMFLLGKPME